MKLAFSIQAASSSLQLRKYLSQAPVEDQVGVAVIGRFIPVDEDQAVAAVVLDETGGRIYREAGATYHQQVCLTNGADAAGQRLLVQALLIKDDIRLDRTPTGAQRYPLGMLHILRRVKFSTFFRNNSAGRCHGAHRPGGFLLFGVGRQCSG